jgi:DHA2 family multidrug resistance protein-like MFS transporter
MLPQQSPEPGLAPVDADGLPPGARQWAIMSLAIGVGMASLDTAIANTALPAMANQLQATPAASVWIINAYQLAMVATLLPFAALGETVGYRRVCVAGLAVFTLASLACALAWSLPSLVVARLIQGVGASAVMSVNTAMLRAIYPSHLQGRAFGINSMVVAVSFAIGPTAASLILSVAPWPWLFAINVPFGVIAFFLGRRVLPPTKRASHKVDLLTGLYNVGAFGLLILVLGDAAHQASMRTLLPEIAGAAICFALLLHRQAAHAAPMLPVDLLRRPMFALATLTAICTFSAQSLAFVGLPFYFETTLGRSPIDTGFLMTPWAVLVAVMAPIAGRLSDRYSPGVLGGIGLATLSLGLVTLLLMPAAPSAWNIGWRMALCGVGFGFFQAPNLKAFMVSAPPERGGSASGMVATARLIGQATGAALVAYCFILSSEHGARYSLGVAASFAAVASVASFLRLVVVSPK